ncbi:flippase-like domain-containing protein [Candidatus Pacearchaeota archaeon]|nr:flippase-like domain-containing protein [Candidatus Pacearchaeota archaeon]
MKRGYKALVLIVILLLVFLALRNINFAETYNLLKTIKLSYFGIALLLSFLAVLVWNLRFKYLMNDIVKGKFFFLLIALFSGTFVNSITPGATVGGEPIRAYYIGKEYKKPKSKILGIVFADKAVNMMVFSFFVILSILFVFIYFAIPSYLKVIFGIAIGVVCIFLFLFFIFISKNLKINFSRISRFFYKFSLIKRKFRSIEKFNSYLSKRLNNIIQAFSSSLKNKNKLFLSIILSVIYWLLTYLVSYFIFLSFDERINFAYVIVVVTLGYLIGDFSPSPGGAGFVEGIMFVLYSVMGIAPSLAFINALLTRLIYYFYNLGIGGLCLAYLRLKIKS